MKKLSLVLLMVVFCGAMMFGEVFCGETMDVDYQTPHPYTGLETDSLVWTQTIHKTGASWLKVHFNNFKLDEGDFVVLYDMYGNPVETIYGGEVKDDVDPRFRVIKKKFKKVSFWGPMIDGDEVRVELHSKSEKNGGHGFGIDEVGYGFFPIERPANDAVSVESICGTDDKEDIKCAATSYQTTGLAVGRMLYQKRKSWYVCTGFLVSSCSSHFLTNEHCITSQKEVDTLEVSFKYRYTTCGGGTLDSTVVYYGDDFVTDSRTYDYCLLTLLGTPQTTYGYLDLLNRAASVNEDIYIIQHPGGNPQQIGYGTVYNTTANSGKDVGYYVDTEGGSSGSPVLAENGDGVIALHHYGGCPNSGVKMTNIYNSIIGYICN